jgi:putative pyruvate formate lyase activating enzyme
MKTTFWLLIYVFFVVNFSCSGQNTSQKNNDMKNDSHKLPYHELHKDGILQHRGQELWNRMESCDLCPRNCGVNRLEGQRGICKANSNLEIASYGPHFGEEKELVGSKGSGTIFFTNCAMLCVFCINSDISHGGYGKEYSIERLADIMLELQKDGRHNINLVSPSHYIAHILLALDKATSKGLNIPVVYNTSGWEKTEILNYLDGVVDIYLSDFKYGCNEQAGKYSIGAFDYVETAQKAHLEMQRQVGVAMADPETGLMQRGLMIRHLVMPNNVSCSEKVMQWIALNLPKSTYVNIMSQYTPVFHARNYHEISRSITRKEYLDVIEAAQKAGLTNFQVQGN